MSEPGLNVGTTQSIAVAATSAATSNAFDAETTIVRISTTTNCYIAFGSSPTATTSDVLMPAGTTEYFKVPVPGTSKLAAIRDTADGKLRVTEMTV